MHFRALSLLVVGLLACSSATLQETINLKRLEDIFLEGTKSKDLSTLYYSVKGLSLLSAKIPDICKTIKDAKYDLDNMEQVFHLTNAAQLSGCVNYLKPDVMSASTRSLDKKDGPLSEIYHAVMSQKALGKGNVYDKADALNNLVNLLKKEDTPANYGYVFALCEHIGCESWTTQHAEAIIAAADESDGKALHFEGGLPVTALILTSIIRSYAALKKAPPLTADQREKFAQYLVSRRALASPRGAALLLDAALALASQQPVPMSISVKGRKHITADQDTIEISITDFLGRPLKSLKPEEVIVQSATRLSDDVVVLSKQPLTVKKDDPTVYILNLSKIKTQYGVYKISLSAGSKTTSVNISVLGEIQVSTIEVGIGDVDGTTSPKVTTLAYPKKMTEQLYADHLQKLTLKLTVRDRDNKPVLVQQAFVVIARNDGGAVDEAIFVAEPDNSKAYKVELNVGAIAKHLQSGSGVYSVTLLLGDNSIANPISWPLADVQFNFGALQPAKATPPAWRSRPQGPQPEIAHTFRAADPRPPRALSDLFAVLAAAPLLLLLALWIALGANLGRMVWTFSGLMFHAALGGSLALYGVLWLRLTMFETVRYLLPLGALTFLAGHRLLRRLVQQKETK